MTTLKIVPTTNPAILKFEFSEFIAQTNHEFKNIDQAKDSPLELFYLPFVKTVYISGNFIAIERYNIVEWSEVQEEVAEQISEFLKQGKEIITTKSIKKNPISIYAESTPNPNVMKFVANKLLVKDSMEFKNIDDAVDSELAQALFGFSFVKEVFISENYISITKYNISTWEEVVQELRNFIKERIEEGFSIIKESEKSSVITKEIDLKQNYEKLDATSQQIISILDEYVKPAVQSDGGNIAFESYHQDEKIVKVLLQGACSGCPSSVFTLKNGIENMLQNMLQDSQIKVEAINRG